MAVPPVTIGLPIYNVERYLERTLRSISEQTFADFGVIALLDGCTDRSEAILRAHPDDRFVVLKNETNVGVRRTRNTILDRTESPLLAWMDSDDLITPDRLELQVDFMRTHTETDILGAWFDLIDEQDRKIGEPFPLPVDHDAIVEAFRHYGALCHGASLWRTERVRATGGFDYEHAEDYALYLKCLALGYRFANLPQVLLHYRQSTNQIMSRLREPTLQAIDRAYYVYGPRIWGDRAPDYVSGLTRWHRLQRRVRRRFHDWRKDV